MILMEKVVNYLENKDYVRWLTTLNLYPKIKNPNKYYIIRNEREHETRKC